MIDLCRYCDLPVAPEDTSITHAYWGGSPFVCHRECKHDGLRREAYECQLIDSDCNDCAHYRRGKLAPAVISLLKTPDGRTAQVRHQPNVFLNWHCLKFDRPTMAFPNKWSGWPCFEHRRAA